MAQVNVNVLLSETRKEGIEVRLENVYSRSLQVVKAGDKMREEREL